MSIGRHVSALGQLGKSLTPFGVVIDSKDTLYVTNIFNHRITKI
jgi:hypothetical protein